MKKLLKVDWDKFKVLARKIIKYKSQFSYIPIRAENWEEVLYVVFVHMFSKGRVFWNPVSHAKGIDLIVKLNGNILTISAKGGKITKGILSLSSYRLTRYKSLKEKLKFLKDNAKGINVYLVCSREEKTNEVEYKIFKISAAKLIPPIFLKSSNWSKNKEGWKFTQSKKVGFEAQIVKSMSHQLWYAIVLPSPKIELLCNISISKQSLGKLLHEVLKS